MVYVYDIYRTSCLTNRKVVCLEPVGSIEVGDFVSVEFMPDGAVKLRRGDTEQFCTLDEFHAFFDLSKSA